MHTPESDIHSYSSLSMKLALPCVKHITGITDMRHSFCDVSGHVLMEGWFIHVHQCVPIHDQSKIFYDHRM